ncbi:MAG: hypothetical protein KDM81_11100, partial [Verrucomicrobiae bacterium]|nr:hypothetical protein [Verrucomicrobiae bacterium]
ESLDRRIETEGQLLVEGRTPEMFFREMIAAFDLTNALQVRTFGDIGKANLQTYLELFTQKSAFKERVRRLGIIRDAEAGSAQSAFQSVQSALRGASLPVPSIMREVAGNQLAVGVFVLPNCKDPGMLETLCLAAVEATPESESLLPCVDDFFACVREQRAKPANPTKARFAGYALAQDIVDPQLGRAAQKGAIPWHAKAFEQLRSFLTLLSGSGTRPQP